MLKHLEIQNIKCFSEASFLFSNLTVFCGPNSAGKSTAIQCLLLLRQTYNKDKFAEGDIYLVGEYFSAGHVSDIINHRPTTSVLRIKMDDMTFSSDISKLEDLESYRLTFAAQDDYKHDIFLNNFIYLSAERMGPRNSYDVSFDSNVIDIGIYGQYAISEFIKRANKPTINRNLATRYTPQIINTTNQKHEDITLEVAVKEAMKTITPGFDIKYQSIGMVDKVSNTFASDNTHKHVRPTNTGFGVSNLLPIIIGGFCLQEGDTLIVENPEIHLHPGAQSALARFLANVAQSGVQVIIETHSDHIVNGLRVFIKENPIFSSKAIINSIGRIDGNIDIKSITIDEDGNLTDSQEGFFDQTEKDLLKLF